MQALTIQLHDQMHKYTTLKLYGILQTCMTSSTIELWHQIQIIVSAKAIHLFPMSGWNLVENVIYGQQHLMSDGECLVY